jgi:tRNA modification GTPase
VRKAGTDTICAIATPPGIGGVGIIRVSGPAVPGIAAAICGHLPANRLATYGGFRAADGSNIDHGIAVYFPAPHSFTGEGVLELQGHGGPVVLQMLLRRVMSLGARAARAGEFSERAFLNDKLDLAQAEAIADLISSGTEAAARAAQLSLSGAFSRRIEQLQERLTGVRVYVEAAIDFPTEEIDFLADGALLQRLQETQQGLRSLLAEAQQGRLLRDGMVLAIIGRPNAGKSSLLNALSGQDSAIVTAIAGTTRDVLREWIDLDGIPVHVADTAGIRDTADVIEAEGVRRARQALSAADIVLLIVDVTADKDEQLELLRELPDPQRCILVYNKMDLLGQPYGGWPNPAQGPAQGQRYPDGVALSAQTGEGLVTLKARIRQTLGATEQVEGGFSARQRHVDALQRAEHHLLEGELRLTKDQAGELLAEELRLAQRALGEITGELLPDDLLGVIFSSFCIGK